MDWQAEAERLRQRAEAAEQRAERMEAALCRVEWSALHCHEEAERFMADADAAQAGGHAALALHFCRCAASCEAAAVAFQQNAAMPRPTTLGILAVSAVTCLRRGGAHAEARELAQRYLATLDIPARARAALSRVVDGESVEERIDG
jgi:hypothetical protein